jgi:hypothetical protein
MKALMCLVACVALMSNLHAEQKQTPRERRVKVALAITEALPVVSCGSCRPDEAEARKDALKEGKPLVLFVGGCLGCGETAVGAGAIPVQVATYDGDKRPATEPRVVVLSPKGTTFEIEATLAYGASEAEIRKAVADATPKKAVPPAADWQILAAPAKQYQRVCVNGVCTLVEVPAK